MEPFILNIKPFRNNIVIIYNYHNMEKSNYTEGHKVSIMKWRNTNKDKYNEYMKGYNNEYYHEHGDMFRKKRMDKYYFQKEARRLCCILFNSA